jgi:transcriptional regulator of acetoin/glycerol metabolism
MVSRALTADRYLLQLTDPDGVVVDFRCNDDVRDRAIAARIIPGSIWSEDQQGTNGIGTGGNSRSL